jgi:NAD(P)-dependent dehydrogenase (short-subunit alcohol dehydrogenase family)|tara:strand:+ start:84239 stop:85114 length:876 start_codon:yes stop_codon:yes gene_type:complete
MYNKGMLPEGTFNNKVVLITGGGTGLGKSIGEYLVKLGAKIIITSRRQNVIDETAEEFNKISKNSTIAIAGDVRNHEDVKNVIETGFKHFKSIDCLINNAAGNFISPTERLTPGAFDAIIDIVLKGSTYYTLLLGKKWIKNKIPGTILNITTTYAFTGSGYVIPSACAKGGLSSMTRSIAAEWAKYKIRCNAIAPGPFPTKGAWDRLVPPGFSKFINMTKRIPLKRMGEHQELSNLAAYLLSDYSSYMTGEIVTLDGGEWTYNAGQFSFLDKIPKAMWSLIEKTIRKKNKK